MVPWLSCEKQVTILSFDCEVWASDIKRANVPFSRTSRILRSA
jgi:hypothetical protein